MAVSLRITFLLFAIIALSSCNLSGDFEVSEFNAVSNYSKLKNDSTLQITADLSQAVLNGIEIPTIRQLPGGKFAFTFKLENNSVPQQYFYKIYYQNETYKWPEGDSLDNENFYGTWEEAELEFKRTPLIEDDLVVTDSFRIVGNPRNEKIYSGADPKSVRITDSLMNLFIGKIYKEKDWYESVLAKSKENKVSMDEQVYNECMWAINHYYETDSTYNNRWKRNPRMGNYKFMLVVCDGEGLAKIPDAVRNISLKDAIGKFVNPFTFFSKDENKKIEGVKVVTFGKQLCVNSKLDLGSGIYVDPFKVNQKNIDKSFFNSSCGESYELYSKAHFAQYFHHINRNWEFVNVKESKDVVEEKLTRKQYDELVSNYTRSKNFIHVFSSRTNCPCKTVSSDSSSNSISIMNPGNEPGQYNKEHVGIYSRIGFTYGKWRAKIKFPKLISEDNVWNGITAAYWLIYQNDAPWNNRRNCNSNVGYIPKQFPDNEESVKQSRKTDAYSEIDFEILKESKYWVRSAYGDAANYPKEDASLNNDITVCCTNWDLACQQPKNYVVGAKTVDVDGYSHEFCRWNYYNKLVTSKKAVPHKEICSDDYCYFEIDWQPKRIIWRIGKDKSNLREICRMNDDMTSIPNNQMVMIMSQEFHYQEWWPTAPFLQNFIPFPKNNIIGKLMEVEIE